MELPRPVIWLLVIFWLTCFACFVIVSYRAFSSGHTFEYKLYGLQAPYAEFVLLICMAASSGLLWANYKGQDFRGAEELVYGSLFGVSAFGLMLSVVLVLLA